MLPYTAYLRVYQPLTAFPSAERAYWLEYAESPERPRRAGAVAAEHRESLRRLVAAPPRPAPEEESGDAYVRRMGGRTYICPWQTRLRSWLGLREFRTETPAALSPAYLPEAVARSAEDAFRRWRDRGEPLRTHILTSNWTVPLPWFAPFSAEERCLVLEGGADPAAEREAEQEAGRDSGGPAAPGGAPRRTAPRVLLYVTEASLARERLERAVAALQENIGDGPLLAAAERLEDWLASVAHPDALLELDYGGLVHLLDDERLREDESAAEVAAAVAGLERGEDELAVAMYRRAAQRWKSVRALERAN
ncbi:hypothetical protein [Nocardiopsis composta]|uniref:DUF8083 domain-containing protein n=1 Tax=Nocardiopsis composta TaxID=157465 RepID=A0A7W8QMJ9_9ACTN|nr:hypothetical protein [Nocardiopsis composta]MBB5433207.1 hypothetical protein [Nocardiopsis composta]